MNTHALSSRRKFRQGERTTDPASSSDHGLTALARDAGLRTPDSVATPEMAEQSGTPVAVLRWVPLYVIGLAIVLTGGIGLLVLTVL